VAGAEGLLEERVRLEVNLPDGQVVGRAPPGVDVRQLAIGKGRHGLPSCRAGVSHDESAATALEAPASNRPLALARTTDRVFSRTSATSGPSAPSSQSGKPRPVHFEISHEFDIPLDALELAVISPALVDKLGAKVLELGVGIEAIREKTRS